MFQLSYLRAAWRLLYFIVYTIGKITQIVLANLLKGEDPWRSMHFRAEWARRLLPGIGVRVETQGAPPTETCLVMGNHRSYLDPIVLMQEVMACPVSKAEVANWPLIGYGARVTGILFLKRENIASRKRTLGGIADKLRSGMSVILFPEGTTHDRDQCLPFKPGGFKLAVQEQIPIAPIAIDYGDKADYWIGNDTFLPHFFRRFSQREMKVFVHYGPIMYDSDPQVLLESVQNWIDQALQDIRESRLHS